MKTKNTHSRCCKYTAVILAAFLLLFSLSGCLVPADKEMREFWEAENGYNADVQNAIERYGGLCVSTLQEFADGSSQSCDSCVSKEGIVVFVDEDGGWYCIRYEDEWYNYSLDDDGNPCYAKYAIHDENYSLDAIHANPGFIFCDNERADRAPIVLVDRDTTVVKNEDGSYVWTGSYDFDDGADRGTVTSTIYLNADCEITEEKGTYYLEDGSVLLTYTGKFSPGTQNEEFIQALADELEKANGETRHLTYNAVKDGDIVETFEADVPQGFYCSAILPAEYYDEEDNVNYFTDIGLTQEYDSTNPYGDLDIYFSADNGK